MSASNAPSRADAFDIVGGGAAGITVAAEMRRHRNSLGIAIVEPSDTHACQPGWTLVGAGVFSMTQTPRRQETLIPKGVTRIRNRAATLGPEQNAVILADGRRLTHGSLVVCPGLQLAWNTIAGGAADIRHSERGFAKAA